MRQERFTLKHILVIEDDLTLADQMKTALAKDGYLVNTAVDLRSGLKTMGRYHPNLVIATLEQANGLKENLLIAIREATKVPLIVLGTEGEAAMMLELGADAYLTTPPQMRELVARVRALLRRQPDTPPDDGSRLPADCNRALNEGGCPHLSATEFRLAACLGRHRGRVLGYSRLLGEVWGDERVSLDNLHFYVRRLKTKLSAGIVRIRGFGYYLQKGGDGDNPNTKRQDF